MVASTSKVSLALGFRRPRAVDGSGPAQSALRARSWVSDGGVSTFDVEAEGPVDCRVAVEALGGEEVEGGVGGEGELEDDGELDGVDELADVLGSVVRGPLGRSRIGVEVGFEGGAIGEDEVEGSIARHGSDGDGGSERVGGFGER